MTYPPPAQNQPWVPPSPPAAGPPTRRRLWWLIGAAIGAVVLLLLGVGGVVALRGTDGGRGSPPVTSPAGGGFALTADMCDRADFAPAFEVYSFTTDREVRNHTSDTYVSQTCTFAESTSPGTRFEFTASATVYDTVEHAGTGYEVLSDLANERPVRSSELTATWDDSALSLVLNGYYAESSLATRDGVLVLVLILAIQAPPQGAGERLLDLEAHEAALIDVAERLRELLQA